MKVCEACGIPFSPELNRANQEDYGEFCSEECGIKALAKKHCKKCHGRGYVGRNTTLNELIWCSCVKRGRHKEEEA